MQERFNLSKNDSYKIIQNKDTLKELKIKVFDLAYECIDNHKILGSGINQYGFNNLFSLGYITESIGCLTHSYLNDNYFACYNPSDEYKVMMI